ncbi:Atg2p [Sporobolomyces salmoneus]|uniref:Atg2p n=1 Tax=Sporobolomyces salmoneus TaxID=183962 RepID=UPI0031802376
MPLSTLSSLLSYLPTVSISPLIPLPSNLQQRLVSFLLRKTLGGIIKGGLDSDRIEADIRDGSFAINKVEIDQLAIVPLLESTPTLSFVSGTISNISVKVSYPLAQLSLVVSEVEVVLRVRDQAEAEDWLKQSTETINPASASTLGGGGEHDDASVLEESMISIAVAQDFIQHELSPSEDAELRASLHLSPSTAQSDFFLPGGFGEGPSQTARGAEKEEEEVEQVEKTMLAGLIERILARLNVRVSGVKVRLTWQEESEEMRMDEVVEENELEVRVDEIEYLGDASSTEGGGGAQQQNATPSLRAIKISPPRVSLKIVPPPISADSDSSSSSSSSSDDSSTASSGELAQSVSLADSIASLPLQPEILESAHSDSESESESSGDENDLLALSQSIADLRTSTSSLSQSRSARQDDSRMRSGLGSIAESNGGSEMFASAASFVSARSTSVLERAKAEEEGGDDEENPFTNPDSPEPAPEASPSLKPGTPSRLILSLGSASTCEPLVFYLSTQSTSASSSRPTLQVTSTLSSGWIVALTAAQLAVLLELSHRLLPPQTTTQPDATSPRSPSSSSSPLSLSVLLKSITVLLAYPQDDASDVFSQFWSAKDPASLPSVALKCPHLRLKLDEISTTLQNGRFDINVKDLTLCEVSDEGKGEKQGWKALPILVSDNGLTREGSCEIGGDWTIDGAGLTKDWRIKVPSIGFVGGSRRKSSHVEEEEERTDAISISLRNDGKTDLQLSPLHLFVDLTILARLSPLIDTLACASSEDGRDGAATPKFHDHRSSSSSRPLTPAPPPPLLSQAYLLDDLSPLPPHHQASNREGPSSSSPAIQLYCPLLRIDVRCPAPKKLRVQKQNESLIRSGIAVVEFEGFKVAKRGTGELLGSVKEARVGIRSIGRGSKLSNFVTISSLSPSDPDSVLPSLGFTSSTDETLTPTLQASLPLIHVKIDKRTLDVLQLFADDLSQFLNNELPSSNMSEGSSTDGIREKMIGSRYFGTKSFRGSARFGKGSEGLRRDSEEEEVRSVRDEGIIKMLINLDVTDLVVDLLVPASPSTTTPASPPKTTHIRLLASDLDLSLTTLEQSSDDLRARLEIGDVRIEELSENGNRDRKVVIARTCPRDLTSAAIQPLVKLLFATSSDPQTDLKDSTVEVGLEGFTYFFEPSQLNLSKDLGNFVKAPEGTFEQVVPNELTRLRLRISNLSLHLTPPTLASRIVLSLDDVSVKTDIMPDLPRTTASIEVRGAKLWVVESAADLKDPESVVGGNSERTSLYWKTKGFVRIGELEKASIVARQGNGLVLPDFELLVSNARAELSLCADSVSAIAAFADDLMSHPSLKMEAASTPPPRPPPLDSRSKMERSSADLFASVDDNAFERAQSIHDLPEFLGDDVPANQAYIANALSQRAKKKNNRQPRRSDASLQDRPGRVTEDIGGETVRMFTSKGLQIHDDWLTESTCTDIDYSAPASRIRLRLSKTDISIRLHEGYDWSSTRRTIEEESKAVRRRLEKIRQLLADGQTPDATAENASVFMFGSHHLGLPPGANEMAPKDLLAAIDEELEQQGGGRDEDAASTAASSWQTFPAGGSRSTSAPSKKPAAAVVGKSRKKLTRSKAFAIEVNVRGLNASFDSFSMSATIPSSTSQPASKIKVDVGSFEILDNIKTSTWRKFLTEMRPSDGGLVRASGSPMAKLEVTTAKPVGKVNSAQEEISMKIKISPLRLYIDQDALDFLKAFGAFKAPSSAQPAQTPATSPPAQEPFFQRVEVLPVKIKLDYKPKRVDYYALKQGKTAELMNFFHFDGSEMVLRHLVVTGVSGTTTLSNLVQDIWTPDVKANQLADVLSGIAPVRSVVNVGSGVANLVLLPIEQYRKDGRVVRGLQKGAHAFAKQTTLEAINVGAKLANGTQVILEQAEHVLGAKFPDRITGETLSTTPPVVGAVPSADTLIDLDELSDEEIKKVRSRYAEQPTDLRQGVQSAYKSLGENFKEAAQTILAVPMEVYERSGNEGPVRAVVRAVPIAVLRPMIGASGAVSKALLGLRNTLDPDQQEGELEDKYKPRPSM